MSRPRFLLVTGTARSGSTLLSMMLDAHRDIRCASDPYLPVFRSLRNAILRHRGTPETLRSFDAAGPFQDYYFTDDRLRILDCVQAGDLDIPFDPSEREEFLRITRARGEHNCPDLVPYYDRLPGPTYRGIFDNALDLIAEHRKGRGRRWVGFKDVWTVEFFPALARAYPDARFVLLLRDPGAVVASLIGMAERDPTQAGHTLSYLRHCRKFLAFAVRSQTDRLLRNRVFVLTYERLVREPESLARQLCDFLEVDFDPGMLDTGNYFDHATGAVWAGNSSFAAKTTGIQKQAPRWRTKLPPAVVQLVDLVCGPEMALAGYEPETTFAGHWPNPEVLEYLICNNAEPASWRSDLGDPQQDYGCELFRRALLEADERLLDPGLVRRSFLFPEVFAECRKHRPIAERQREAG